MLNAKADQPIEPLRGELEVITFALAKVTNLNQDLTYLSALDPNHCPMLPGTHPSLFFEVNLRFLVIFC